MTRRPPISTRTYPLLPYTTLFRSETFPMKKALFVAAAVIAAPIAFSPIHAQEAVSRPQPVVQPLTIPLPDRLGAADRSEEHTSELQSLMRISYAVFCLKKKKNKRTISLHCMTRIQTNQ